MQITTIGLDIAKNVFQVHGIDAAEKVVVRKQLRRGQMLAFFKALPPCLVGMEACATLIDWLGQIPVSNLMQPVATRGKSDGLGGISSIKEVRFSALSRANKAKSRMWASVHFYCTGDVGGGSLISRSFSTERTLGTLVNSAIRSSDMRPLRIPNRGSARTCASPCVSQLALTF